MTEILQLTITRHKTKATFGSENGVGCSLNKSFDHIDIDFSCAIALGKPF